jgi:hypothetical protein
MTWETENREAAARSVLEKITERDQQWFRDHPRESMYVRRLVPGEFDCSKLDEETKALFETASHVLVARYSDRVRVRMPCRWEPVH